MIFNRNTGQCVTNDGSVVCLKPPVSADCPAGQTGWFPGPTCYKYMYCNNGENFGTFLCAVGQSWAVTSPGNGNCVYDATCIQVAPTPFAKVGKINQIYQYTNSRTFPFRF